MSKNRRNFSPEFKTKLVIELLESGKTLNEIASKYDVLPKSLIAWKRRFIENASIVFEESVPSKKYKDEIKEKEQKNRGIRENFRQNGYGKYKSKMLLCGCQKKSI